MPARLHFSNSLDALAERLRTNLQEENGDPFMAPVIATPASALRDWLKIHLAEKDNIAVNLSFPPLETLLWDRLAERDLFREAADRQPARLLDTFSFQGLVLARLRRDPPSALRDYLASSHHEDAARRLCQLSGQLASLFREYEYNRVAERGYPGLTESWMARRPSFEPHLLRGNLPGTRDRLHELQALEAWQLDVYHSLFRRDDGLRDLWGAATGVYRYTLPQYAALTLDANEPVVPPDPERVYHLFGLSNISPFHRDLIGRLADERTLGPAAARFEIYALNPCAEFWEDALTLRERRARGARKLTPAAVAAERVHATQPDATEREAGTLHEVDDENGMLALFGKPGRETIKLWCQLTDHDFHEDFREPSAPGPASRPTLLQTVRRMLLHRMGPLDGAERIAPDTSLRFGLAEDPRAELESVRNEIAEALAQDETLRPEDLAVIPADTAAVLPLLRAVFAGDDRVPGNVPVLLPEGGGSGEGPFLAGFRALLTCATGEPTRADLLELLANPCVLKSSGLDAATLPVVEGMLEDAGFARGWGVFRTGFADAPTLADATERLLASLAFDAEATGLGEAPFPQPVAGLTERLDATDTGLLLDWLVRLQETAAPFRDGAARPFGEWARLLRGLRDALLAAGPADARDALDLRRFLDELEAWDAWKTGAGGAPGGDIHAADATLVTMLFADRFRNSDEAGRTLFLRGGVRVGGLSALRGIPFRRVWITGLTSAFPASAEAMPLDLRAFRRLPGESDPAARDLYALLEVLATCTDALSLSWHRRGADGKDRQPSRALTGMMAWLESDVLPAGLPDAFENRKPSALPPPPIRSGAAATYVEEPPRTPHYVFKDVVEFLRNPASHAIRRLTARREGDVFDDSEPMPSEDLFVGKWSGQDLVEACLRAELVTPGDATRVFDGLWETRRRAGLAPPEPWATAERMRLLDALKSRLDGEIVLLRAWMEATGMRFLGSLRLGPQGLERAEAPVRNVPAFDLTPVLPTDASRARLGGVFPWFFHGPVGWAIRAETGREHHAYLLQLCATGLAPLAPPLSELFAGQGYLIGSEKDGKPLAASPLPPLDAGTARERLRNLMTDYAGALRGIGHLDDVPLDEVAEVLDANGGRADAVTDWGEELLERRGEVEEQGHARYTRDQRRRRAIAPELPDDFGMLVRRRALPYLEWKTALSELQEPASARDAAPRERDGETA